MPDTFTHDVFLSHSPKDRTVLRELAGRLKENGLRVWFNEWEIQPGDDRAAKIEEGLEHSRVLVLCLSANAFGSDWARLEAGTFRFRDPLDLERRFIPLRLDDAPIPDSLAQFLSLDWREEERGQEYEKLLEACRPPRTELDPEQQATRKRVEGEIILSLTTESTRSVAFSPDGKHALSGSEDKLVRLWDLETGGCLRVLEGHFDKVISVAWSPDGRSALSGSSDNTVRLWDLASKRCLRVLKGHSSSALSVAWSPDGRQALSGSHDRTVRLWDIESGHCLRVLEGHSDSIWSVAWNPDGRRAATGSDDRTVRLWDLESGGCLRVLEGHSNRIWSVAWNPDGRRILSGSYDKTMRLWDVESRRCLRVLKGHSKGVLSVAWSPDGRRALSGSADHTVWVWDVESKRCLRVLEGHSNIVLSVAWSPNSSCALSGSYDKTVRLWDVENRACLRTLDGHSQKVLSVAWSPDGHRVLSSSSDKTVRLWDVASGRSLHVFEGHSSIVGKVAWSPDGRRALSGSLDKTVRLWDVESGSCLRVFRDSVSSVVWSPSGQAALTGSKDNSVRLWDVESGDCLRVLEGHSDAVLSVAWSPSGNRGLSGSRDHTLRLWEIESGYCMRVFEGHAGAILSVAWSPNGRLALSGSTDKTIRLWDIYSGRCLRVIEGHSNDVLNVAWSPDGSHALSGSADHTLRLWEVDSGRCLHVLNNHSDSVFSVAWSLDGSHAFSAAPNGLMRAWNLTDSAMRMLLPTEPSHEETQVQYTNAKVLLVGESGAGKTGLSKRLAGKGWEPTDSTVGAWATQWKLPVSADGSVEREIWLWDFGGQADQRLIHQLYMEETAVAVLVFDGQREDLFESLGQWDRDLARAARKDFKKLLAAGRVDAGGLRVSRSQMDTFCKERGFGCFLETSAKQDIGCRELKEAILAGIDWERIPWRSSPLLFKRLKEEIVRLKDEGRVLMRFNELRDALHLRLAGEDIAFKNEELKAVVGLLAGPGVVWELAFGNWVLLQPERINAYAQAVIQTLREDELERGCLPEERVLRGDLRYHSSLQRLPVEEERFVLLAMHQTLVERGLCLREHTDKGPLLIFPSFYRRERPEIVGHPAVLVSYRFNGFLDDIYATLVVRLHHTEPFQQDQLWRYAADFKTLTGRHLGVKLTRRAEGAGEIEVYFDPTIPVEEVIIFSRYVHEHLQQKGQDVVRLRHYVCPHCKAPVKDRETAMERLKGWLEHRPAETSLSGKIKAFFAKPEEPTILCTKCEKRVPLWDDLEECFASPETRERVRQLQAQSDRELDNESKDRALVGEVISTVALAGQIIEEYSAKRYGLDMEIEFKDDEGKPTAKKLYLQLKSGDSHLRRRERDGAEVFQIHHEHHARYWVSQAYPVFLVIANSQGEVRWMEIRDYLKRASDNGKKPVAQIVFTGERFDVMSVRRWRHRVLG